MLTSTFEVMATEGVQHVMTYVVWAVHKIEVRQHLIHDPESFADSLKNTTSRWSHVGSEILYGQL